MFLFSQAKKQCSLPLIKNANQSHKIIPKKEAVLVAIFRDCC